MSIATALDRMADTGRLDGVIEPIRRTLNKPLRPPTVRDALHGGLLGHPLHPALAQVPLGAWPLNRQRWNTREQLHLAIITWIEKTYHRRRRQDRLGRLTRSSLRTSCKPLTRLNNHPPRESTKPGADPVAFHLPCW